MYLTAVIQGQEIKVMADDTATVRDVLLSVVKETGNYPVKGTWELRNNEGMPLNNDDSLLVAGVFDGARVFVNMTVGIGG